ARQSVAWPRCRRRANFSPAHALPRSFLLSTRSIMESRFRRRAAIASPYRREHWLLSSPPTTSIFLPQALAPRRRRWVMTLAINDTAPDFEAETTEGKIRFHDWIGDKWVVLFSHPKDFTPVCTTELGYMARIKPEFDKRGVKIIGLSVDPLDKHSGWANDIKET